MYLETVFFIYNTALKPLAHLITKSSRSSFYTFVLSLSIELAIELCISTPNNY